MTATFSASADEVFAYLADTDNLRFFFELRADRQSGVIDMLAGPRENAFQLFPGSERPNAVARARYSHRSTSGIG